MPDKIFAGKLIRQGNGVNIATFRTLEGKADKGTNKPERKRYGTNINLSRALDFSVQKQSAATKL